jgi:hypothetical protein
VVENCGISRVWVYNEWAACDDGDIAHPGLVEIIYDPPLPIVNGTFSGEGTVSGPGPENSWWDTTLRFAGQFTSDSAARGEGDMEIWIKNWAGSPPIHCVGSFTWRAFRE